MGATITLRLGTRKSMLALAQAKLVADEITRTDPEVSVELAHFVTRGDRAPQGAQDKRDWILEIEDAVVRGEVEFAIHSAKDVPVDVDPATCLVPVLSREDPRDVLITATSPIDGPERCDLASLRANAVVGTCSLRRQGQLRRLRPDLKPVEIRGNVPTRLEKLRGAGGEFDAIVLAAAGLKRLGLANTNASYFSFDEMLPAVNQGILVLQLRSDRRDLLMLAQSLTSNTLTAVWSTERECVRVLGADCNSAVSVYAQLVGDELELRTRVIAVNGTEVIEQVARDSADRGTILGRSIAERLLALGAKRLLSCRI